MTYAVGAVSGDPLGWSPTALRKAIPLERGPPSVSRVDVEGPHAVPVADMGVRCRLPHPAGNQTVVMVWSVHAEVHIPPPSRRLSRRALEWSFEMSPCFVVLDGEPLGALRLVEPYVQPPACPYNGSTGIHIQIHP